ncbi:hypothetical protein PUNSTDRAFT_136353 [Punctularia strigosozonata HHB-11173 SS5]|uniref:uncharacterized protein n=1 Tax=Punctularia strigosozonata (strain HHB-11173) TaxID=741275 RepID=UPI0004416CFE|nr:uncharacterized protein PUNSTDRAFT_136353 [Punctularia strigosozonata HHB-11173 SS5]EIN06495.1 hypothetical protein PUNSTDRAFT_136353 [Punctularia strigosozonata HHB-11173 SS5]
MPPVGRRHNAFTKPLYQHLRAELIVLAQALDVSSDGSVVELKERLQKLLFDRRAELMTHPDYELLYTKRQIEDYQILDGRRTADRAAPRPGDELENGRRQRQNSISGAVRPPRASSSRGPAVPIQIPSNNTISPRRNDRQSHGREDRGQRQDRRQRGQSIPPVHARAVEEPRLERPQTSGARAQAPVAGPSTEGHTAPAPVANARPPPVSPPAANNPNSYFIPPDVRQQLQRRVHIQLHRLTDAACAHREPASSLALLLKNNLKASTAAAEISGSKSELQLSFVEWFQAWQRLLQLVRQHLPQQLDAWQAHFAHIRDAPGVTGHDWPVWRAYDADVRRRAMTEGASPRAAFDKGVWDACFAGYVAGVEEAMRLQQSALQTPERASTQEGQGVRSRSQGSGPSRPKKGKCKGKGKGKGKGMRDTQKTVHPVHAGESGKDPVAQALKKAEKKLKAEAKARGKAIEDAKQQQAPPIGSTSTPPAGAKSTSRHGGSKKQKGKHPQPASSG